MILSAVLAVGLATAPALRAATPADCTAKAEGSVNGFYAAALLTGDKDWRAKWRGGAHAALPDVAAAPSLGPGQGADLLVFFAHPLTDNEGGAHINCELRVTQPDGKIAHMPLARCFDDRPAGAEGDLQRTVMHARIDVTPKMARGVWRVALDLTDVVAHRTVPLSFCYRIAPAEGGQG